MQTLHTFINHLTYRYSSRAILIPFQEPSLRPKTREERTGFQKVMDLLKVLSSNAGFIIGMGKKFKEELGEVLLHELEPRVTTVLGDTPVLHRMHIAYASLLYFTILVLLFWNCIHFASRDYTKDIVLYL